MSLSNPRSYYNINKQQSTGGSDKINTQQPIGGSNENGHGTNVVARGVAREIMRMVMGPMWWNVEREWSWDQCGGRGRRKFKLTSNNFSGMCPFSIVHLYKIPNELITRSSSFFC